MVNMLIQRECQEFNTEKHALYQAATLLDGYAWTLTDMSSIGSAIKSRSDKSTQVDPKDYLPAGSVDFMRKAFAAFDIPEPDDIDYPVASEDELKHILGRSVIRQKLTKDLEGMFIKPVSTKAFQAKVYDKVPSELIGREAWVSNPVLFEHEWRVYVLNGLVIGHAQYDDGKERLLSKEGIELAEQVINLMARSPNKPPSSYAIDVGLVGKRHVLVELNDGWATGYYPSAMKQTQYLNWLQSRWMDICEANQSKKERQEMRAAT